ncbi:SipW-dependent-type signal peptide-containing protein [Ruania suaedae]|uniref:SipW-dependent-type signal peptide-containing protein n=1 Tax=Ruania suaedae TaxID=2897774 RepID=UPI001E5BB1E2|nr:SipW-dependent-type signal peptide-containing protein [Ruania suaedae]UFU03020.1 SipW-dependent-type signal peptide-containing protein [Ruania suaedae]
MTEVHRSTRSRKVRAVLAGGLVLGVGAAVTLAAWNDSEFASGLFTAGQFDLQGSTTGATEGYTDHESAGGAAELTFTAPFDNLAPEDVVYAPFWVRLAAETTSPATLDLVTLDSTDGTGTNSENLSYEIYAIAVDATCDETATEGTLLGSGDTLTDDPAVAGETVPLTIGDPTTEPGEAVLLCTVVTAGEDLEQGGDTTAVWQYTATSE